MAKRQPRRRYLSYLLRMWQTGDGEGNVWRASIQSPGSEERHGFASLQELANFLSEQTEDESQDSSGENKR